MMEHFWSGFMKKAELMDYPEMQYREPGDPELAPPPLLARTISKAGPVLSDLTMESDRAKFETFKG